MEARPWHKHYDEGVPPSLSFEDLPLPKALERTARKFAGRTALVFEGRTVSYAELQDSVARLATALSNLGLQKGDRVAIQLPNLPQTVIAYYAVLKVGAIAVMTNPLYVQREVEHQFNDAGVKAAILLDAYWMKTVRPIMDKLPIEFVVLTGIKDYLPFPKNLLFPVVGKKTGLVVRVPSERSVYWLKDLIQRYEPNPPPVDISMEDIANLQYTGGTTGVSKGAMLTHRNLSYNVQQCRAWFVNLNEGGEVMMSALPYFHSFGLTVCMNFSIYIGASQICVANPRDIPKLVKLVQRYRPTLFPAVPTLFNAITNYPGIDRIDISSIKGCISGSAPLPRDVMERFEKLTGGKIAEGYGLTEASPVSHANPLFGRRKTGSIGIPFPDTDCKIVDPEDGTRELGVGEEGEIVIKGPQVMKGYWNREDETAKTLRDGWLYTGDMGKMDEDGYFYVVGRKKDMIIAGGYNIYPREIDEVLYGHPKILEACAVGVPDPYRGETVKAFIVVRPGEKLTAEEVIQYCKERLAAYKVPKLIEFREDLPKSTVGKVLRRVLREEELAKPKAEER